MGTGHFQQFRKNIAVSNADDISRSYKKITKRLNRDFWENDSDIFNCRQVGSYGRRTAIDGISDLDMAFELPWSLHEKVEKYSGNRQYKLLSKVANSIRESYPNSEVKVNGQVVEVKLKRYLVEVLPCFKNEDGAYKYPDSNNGGKWRICNPLVEIRSVNEKNDEKNKNLKRLCKMTRAWKNQHGVPMSGMLVDTLCYNFLTNTSFYDDKSYASYKYMVKDFFSYLVDEGEDKDFWRAPGSKSPVYKKNGKFVPKAKKALKKCNEALEDEGEAIKKWRSVFGRKFPASIGAEKTVAVATEDRSYIDTEEFIEDRFPVDVIFPLDIDCEIKSGDKLLDFLRRVEGSRLEKNVSLNFYIINIKDFSGMGVDIYWKVRNVGQEAERRNMLRGQIRKVDKNGRHKERTSFNGHHFVECYVVKDGVCVARDLIDVCI